MRSDSEQVLDALRSMYGTRSVVDDLAHEDFALVVAEGSDGTIRPIPALLRGRCAVLRSRSRSRLLRRLDLELVSLQEPPPGLLRVVAMGALIREDRALLVPADPLDPSPLVERAVIGAGARLAEPVGLLLDPRRATVEVPQTLAGGSSVADDLAPAAGTYSVAGVLLADAPGGTDLTPGAAVARFLRHVELSPPPRRTQALESIASMRPLLPHSTVAARDGTVVRSALETLR